MRVPLPLPQDIAEGRKVVRVRIGEAGPDGEMAEVLDEQFFPGLLRVEVPRPARRVYLAIVLCNNAMADTETKTRSCTPAFLLLALAYPGKVN